MMLIEQTAVASGDLPVAAFRDHMRLGTGFADIGAEDAALESYLRAAIAAIEGRTAKALISRGFVLEVGCWRRDPVQALPISPVSSVTQVRVVDRSGASVIIDPVRYRLVRDLARPRVEADAMLPGIPVGGRAEIAFSAGFGVWGEVPADLAQAAFMLAANYYESRQDNGSAGAAMPFGVTALIERWRTVRVLGGRG